MKVQMGNGKERWRLLQKKDHRRDEQGHYWREDLEQGWGGERSLGQSLCQRMRPGSVLGLHFSLGSRWGHRLTGWWFSLLLLLVLLPLVLPQCPDSCHCVWESSMVLCTDARLREFPEGLPPDTVTLHLERNYIRSLPEGAFRELTHLRDLYLSHNRISTLSSGALRHLSSELRLLDLSHNLLRSASRNEFGSTRAKIRLHHNPWHCDCTLQELAETLDLDPETVSGMVCESSVRSAGEGSRWEDPGGAGEHAGQPLVKLLDSGVNFCGFHTKTTDVAMLVTMFVWFFMVSN
ncbi:hypothetical protein UPYG_G00177060 [Umbra pygmaea]|uniref:Leucine-rich repeat-containing protein 3 n=1 Tax=Umbra pygmaea TaxID=75934 RepID=A0ABD0WUQ8_UMBPY